MFRDIITNRVEFPLHCWKYVSTSAKDFVSKLLEKNPIQRYTADEIRMHPWINSEHTEVVEYAER